MRIRAGGVIFVGRAVVFEMVLVVGSFWELRVRFFDEKFLFRVFFLELGVGVGIFSFYLGV